MEYLNFLDLGVLSC